MGLYPQAWISTSCFSNSTGQSISSGSVLPIYCMEGLSRGTVAKKINSRNKEKFNILSRLSHSQYSPTSSCKKFVDQDPGSKYRTGHWLGTSTQLDSELWRFMPPSHQCFSPFLHVKLLGTMLRNNMLAHHFSHHYSNGSQRMVLVWDLGEPTHTLVPCWVSTRLHLCLQGTNAWVVSPHPLVWWAPHALVTPNFLSGSSWGIVGWGINTSPSLFTLLQFTAGDADGWYHNWPMWFIHISLHHLLHLKTTPSVFHLHELTLEQFIHILHLHLLDHLTHSLARIRNKSPVLCIEKCEL